jgi:diguanylate cyclase (GGDEF)-like protein
MDMENNDIKLLLVNEAKKLFDGTDMANIQWIAAGNAEELIHFVYVHRPDFIVFNIVNISEDNYRALARLKAESESFKYQLLFIRSPEDAADIVAALGKGLSHYHMKILSLVEKNAQILDFIELRNAREEMRIIYEELKKATVEVNKRNKQLQMAVTNLEKLTVSDYLTGVYNRKYILERIRQEIIRYNRNQKMFSFVICDIDNFKKINDTHGHAFGDQAVIDIAKCLSDTCREMDVLARWGGDEFLFLLPETDLTGALNFCERARKSFERRVFTYDDIKITVSLTFGVAEYDPREGYKESIKNADTALLSGKSGGRNKVVAFGEQPLKERLPSLQG